MRQNVYDDADFFAGYQAMRARRSGAHETTVEPLLWRMLPDLAGMRVLDLGCGDGWLSRMAVEQGARSVLAVDASVRMLALAAERTNDERIEYRQGFIEDVDLDRAAFDCIASVFALHYVADFRQAVEKIACCLVRSGVLVAILEHPIYLASAPERDFEYRSGQPPRWLLQRYGSEGPRKEHWFVDGVVKYHRTMATILNAMIEADFAIEQIEEPLPGPPVTPAVAAEDEARPVVLGIRARRP